MQALRLKSLSVVLLVVASVVFAAQLLWLRQASRLDVSPLFIGLFALVPLVVCASFFMAWHLFLVAEPRANAVRWLFWVAFACCATFWVSFYWVFVFRAAMGIAA
jgi:drug/metabolite transporter (DMT)-like permease